MAEEGVGGGGDYTTPAPDSPPTTTITASSPTTAAEAAEVSYRGSVNAPIWNPGGGINFANLPPNVQEILNSDIALQTLLTRLKQSIASARDFAKFLKTRSTLEEEQATGLKRLAKAELEKLGRSEVRSGTYAQQLADVMRVHERVAENGMQFALALHQMHEDLDTLAANIERGRKTWKHEGLSAEKRVQDSETAMSKAKAKYDGLAEDYDRARTGDTRGSKRLGLKGPKSAEQYEQDLWRKVQAADSEYAERVRGARGLRDGLVSTERPKAVRGLVELIEECDSGLVLQLQKFATFNEKLILGNGLAVTPLTDKDSAGAQRSMRDTVRDIDNETDLYTFVRAQRAPPRPNEIKYEQHPTLAPKTQQPTPTVSTTQEAREANTSTWPQSHSQPQSQQGPPTLGLNDMNGAQTQASSMGNRYDYLGAGSSAPRLSDEYAQRPSTAGRDVAGGYPQQGSTFMGNTIMGQPQQQPAAASYNERYAPQSGAPNLYSPHNTTNYDSNEKTAAPAPPYPTNLSERTMQSYASPQQQQTTGSIPPPSASTRQQYGPAPTSTQQPYPPPQTQPQWQPQPQSQSSYPQQTPTNNNNNSAPQRPIFGVPLEDLFQRDQTAIPFLVAQAILAIDAFGLETEGIYRTPGNTAHVAQLKAAFDHAGDDSNGQTDTANLDFRNPANFHQDINAVTSLLKLFFKSLPDPLFTSAAYKQFLEAGRIDIPEQRRDALHALINELPDPNYATLRALVLHLGRVAGREERNRMGSGNLGVCLGPSLMGTSAGQIADSGLQARVLDTIIVYATAIFDED